MPREENILRRTVIKKSFWTFLTTSISRVGGLIFTIILARFLMPEGFGLYSLALSITILFITFADLGISSALLRYVSSSIEKNPRKASAYFHYLLGLKLKVTLFMSLLLLALSYTLSFNVFKKPVLFPLLLVLSAYTFIASIQGFFEALFYTKNKVNRLAIKEAVFQVLRIGFVLILFTILAQKDLALAATISLLLASSITLVLTISFYKKLFNFKDSRGINLNKKRILYFIGFLALSSLATVLFSYIDTIIMGLFISLEYIGYYKAAMSLVITIAGALSFPGVFLSVLTKIREENLQETFDKILKTLLMIIIPATIGLIILSRYFIVFLYGYEYLKGAILLYILSPFIFLFVTSSIFLNVLAAREKTRDFSLLTIFCTVLNISLITFAIKLLVPYSELAATIGVASATLASWTLYFIGSLIILHRRMNLRFKFKFMINPLIASAFMALAIYLVQYFSPDVSLVSGIIEVILGVCVYFLAMFFLGDIKKQDISFIRSLLPF